MEIAKRHVDPDLSVVEFSGRIVLGRESQRIEWLVDEWLGEGSRKFIFDMSKVDYIDSAGLGIMVGSAGKIKASGGALRLVGVIDRIKQIFRITDLDRVLTVDSTVEAACSAFGGTNE